MICGEDIESLIRLFTSRRVSLFHACQFADFQSYLCLGGIPSRECLEKNAMSFTEFETDQDDHSKGVWDSVFLNLADFGHTFARQGAAVPNPYGPILLELHPSVLNEALDAAICIQPVGGSFTSRKDCSLTSIEAIDRLFKHPVEVGYPLSTWVKFKNELREEYPGLKICDPDISCTTTNGMLSMSYVSRIVVDPYFIGNKSLRAWVDESVRMSHLQLVVRERVTSRSHLYKELAKCICQNILSSRDLAQNTHISQELSEWVKEIERRNLAYQFSRYATYLLNGTLLRLL